MPSADERYEIIAKSIVQKDIEGVGLRAELGRRYPMHTNRDLFVEGGLQAAGVAGLGIGGYKAARLARTYPMYRRNYQAGVEDAVSAAAKRKRGVPKAMDIYDSLPNLRDQRGLVAEGVKPYQIERSSRGYMRGYNRQLGHTKPFASNVSNALKRVARLAIRRGR